MVAIFDVHLLADVYLFFRNLFHGILQHELFLHCFDLGRVLTNRAWQLVVLSCQILQKGVL